MFKKLCSAVCVTVVSLCACAATPETTEAKRAETVLCNVAFANVKGVEIVATKIPESSLRTRVDNERFAACPYKVELKYKNQSLKVDFGSTFTSEDVRNYDPAFPINTGYFILDEAGWRGESEVAATKNAIEVSESNNAYFVSGSYARAIAGGKTSDHCFSMALITKDGFATTGLCSPSRATIEPLVQLASKGPVLRYVGK